MPFCADEKGNCRRPRNPIIYSITNPKLRKPRGHKSEKMKRGFWGLIGKGKNVKPMGKNIIVGGPARSEPRVEKRGVGTTGKGINSRNWGSVEELPAGPGKIVGGTET